MQMFVLQFCPNFNLFTCSQKDELKWWNLLLYSLENCYVGYFPWSLRLFTRDNQPKVKTMQHNTLCKLIASLLNITPMVHHSYKRLVWVILRIQSTRKERLIEKWVLPFRSGSCHCSHNHLGVPHFHANFPSPSLSTAYKHGHCWVDLKPYQTSITGECQHYVFIVIFMIRSWQESIHCRSEKVQRDFIELKDSNFSTQK